MADPAHVNGDDFDLARLDADFAQAPIEDRDEVPDGTYIVKVERAELTRAKKSGNMMLRWILRIQGPRHQKRLLWRHSVIASPDNLKWLKSDLHTCGVDLGKLSDLPNHVGRLVDLTLEVAKVSKNGNSNVYINKRVTAGADDPGEGGDGGYSDRARDALKPF